MITIEKLEIKAGHIPLLVFRPEKYSICRKTIIYYHGWSSSVDKYTLLGQLLAQQGYQVILPELSNHGKRGSADYDNFQGFTDVLVETVAEFLDIKDIALERLNGDRDNLVIGGHSLGGMIVSSILSIDPSIKHAFIFNGLFDFEQFIEKNISYLDAMDIELLREFNPKKRIENLDSKSIDIHVGSLDKTIPKKAMITLQRDLKTLNIDKSKILFTYYEDAGHGISYSMIFNALKEIKKTVGLTKFKQCCGTKEKI